ncbi:MAG: hypothetical protein AAGA67_05760, partial [Cyanobacteria bacterium P01_F01_bin.153]
DKADITGTPRDDQRDGAVTAKGRLEGSIQGLLASADEVACFKAEDVAGAVFDACGLEVKPNTISRRWSKVIGKAIDSDRLRSGKEYTGLFLKACVSYAQRESFFPGTSKDQAAKLWVEAIKDRLSSLKPITPTEVFSPGDNVLVHGRDRLAVFEGGSTPAPDAGGEIAKVAHEIQGWADADYESALDANDAFWMSTASFDDAMLQMAARQGQRLGNQMHQVRVQSAMKQMGHLASESAQSARESSGMGNADGGSQ